MIKLLSTRPKFTTHEEYIASMPLDVQKILFEVQARVEQVLPEAERCISYGMPAYRMRGDGGTGKVFFYFAGFKKHLGVYPPVNQDSRLIAELAPYRNEKGNLAFPLKDPIPFDLIRRVALALAKEYAQK
ncbi:DUF1801 domain-containing protein [Undibacterium sp. LX40W]|uniref:DUF1801 domain-containing protein n=1 Tax=Undibacterium nitidum TaxID=2762298 RepID=A0A923HPY4_9BURK|nr:DUF1801 domain-containing protein [Undibacterium nitidum]MBC3881871.1 DUF1801 domain-containing protein [Undibacterium nitidum]MBC3892132.1 DUF1801 domain-containing protein [Undibacterium sp. LX40W]